MGLKLGTGLVFAGMLAACSSPSVPISTRDTSAPTPAPAPTTEQPTDVDDVQERVFALIATLEDLEAGPEGNLKNVPCSPGTEVPSRDLLIGKKDGDKVNTMTMACPTAGSGQVLEDGLWTGKADDPNSATWAIRAGKGQNSPRAALAVTGNGFRMAISGRDFGQDAMMGCGKAATGDSFLCDGKVDGNTKQQTLEGSKGRSLTDWLRGQILQRLGTMKLNLAVTDNKPAAATPAP